MAYVVGSASVEIVPDFRKAQVKITEFFRSQDGSVKVPVEFKLDEQAATRARTASAKVQRDITDDTRKQTVERQAMYERLFKQIDAQEAQSARARAKTERDAAADYNRAWAQALQENARLDRAAAQERSRVEREAARAQKDIYDQLLREQAQAERDQTAQRRRATIEQNAIYSELLREQVAADRAAAKERVNVERDLQKQRETLQREQSKRDQDSARKSGGSIGEALGSTIITNAEREIKARSFFLTAALAGIFVAGAPAILGGATALFGGIGLAATASVKSVQDSWRLTWNGILADTRASASDFIQVHKNLATNTTVAFAQIRPALDAAFSAAAPLTEAFGNSLLKSSQTLVPGFVRAIEGSGPIVRGFGDLLQGTAVGVNGLLDNLVSQAPAAGGAMSSLGHVLENLLPLVGEILAVGVNLAGNALPLLTAALATVNGVLHLVAPVLPILVAGFTALKIVGVLATLFKQIAFATGVYGAAAGLAAAETTGLSAAMLGRGAAGLTAMAGGAASLASTITSVAPAIAALGVIVIGIAKQHSDASSKEDQWANAILAGGQAAADAYKNYKENTHWGQSVDEATGLAASWDDAKKNAAKLRAEMTPLQLAQSNLTAATNDLKQKTDEYGPSSREAAAASREVADAQRALESEQRKANIALRDTIPSAEAAKTALEDYQKALALGDVDGATEALARYKEQSVQAAQEQINLDAALGVTADQFRGYPDAASSAQLALMNIDSATGATTEQIAGAIQKIDEWRSNLQSIATDFVDPLDTYRRLLEAKSEDERKAAQATADSTVSSKDSWRDYLQTTEVGLDEYATKLEEQIKHQEEWRANISAITARGGLEVAQILADMGVQGADLTAKMATATAADFDRMKNDLITDAHLGGAGAVAEMDTQMRVLAEVAKRGGTDAAVAMNQKLQDGTITLAQIAQQYGINLANGINPILTSLGKAPVQVGGGGIGRAIGQVVLNADGNLYEQHTAQIAAGSPAVRVWAEPETGGEAYIPLAPSKRARSLDIWRETGRRLDAFADGGITWPQLDAIRKKLFPASVLTSALRPGAADYHGRGEAIDIGVPGNTQAGLMPIAATLARMYPNSTELIHNPNGSIKNGQQVPPGFWGASTWAAHANHVHWAMTVAALAGAAGAGAMVSLPKPPGTAPFRHPLSTTADATMAHAHDVAQAWVDANAIVASVEANSGVTAGGGGTAAIRALGQQIAASRGVGNQFPAIDSIFTRESNWNPNAQNPTSSAYGIPQFLNATWAAYGGKTSDPGRQINAGISYMNDRYGSPNAANAFWNAHHWYKDGGIFNPHVRDGGGPLLPGFTYNGTGRPEEVVLASSALNGFRAMLGGSGAGAPMPRVSLGQAGSGSGGGEMTNVTGFVNNGTIVVSDMDEFARAAENSKRASLAAIGLI
jgi:hypothetical protein